MLAALLYVGGSVVVLVLLTGIYTLEDIRNRRIVLVRLRESFDIILQRIAVKLGNGKSFFTHGFMRLMLHYGAHTILKRLLTTLRRMESRVEELVRKNRRVAKDIRAAKVKNHLDEIAQHKQEVALSEEEKEERLSQ